MLDTSVAIILTKYTSIMSFVETYDQFVASFIRSIISVYTLFSGALVRLGPGRLVTHAVLSGRTVMSHFA